MSIQFFRSSIRFIFKNKILGAINLLGLSLAFAASFLAYALVRHEMSFDAFHEKKSNIFRLDMIGLGKTSLDNNDFFSELEKVDKDAIVMLPPDLLPQLKENVGDIKNICRLIPNRSYLIGTNGEKVYQENVLLADSSFFSIFSFKFLSGSFTHKDGLVVSDALAKRLFKDGNAVGHNIDVYTNAKTFKTLTVAGVIEALPSNSSLQFDMVLPIQFHPMLENVENGRLDMLFTLGVIETNSSESSQLATRVTRFARKYYAEQLKARQVAPEQLSLRPTPITATHLDGVQFGWPNKGRRLNLFVISIIAVLILLLASINYALLEITKGSGRMVEFGIRKSFGAKPFSLFVLLLLETAILIAFSATIGLVFSILFIPYLNRFAETHLTLSSLGLPQLIAGILCIMIAMAILVGFYPAYRMARWRPVKLLNGTKTYKINPVFSRSMVIVQFATCFVFVISIFVISKQFKFITDKDLGYRSDEIYFIDLYANQIEDDVASLVLRFKSSLAGDPQIKSISGGYAITDPGVKFMRIDGETTFPAYEFNGDFDFPEVYRFKLLEGRLPSPDFPADTVGKGSVVITRGLAAKLGERFALGQPCELLSGATVVGIIEDLHFQSLAQQAAPAFFRVDDSYLTTIAFQIQGSDPDQSLERITRLWHDWQDSPLKITSLKDHISLMYQSQSRWRMIMSGAAMVALIICCFGIFGLAGINTMNKTKELAIRKVLGADAVDIVLRTNFELFVLTTISFLVAVPITYSLMSEWLNTFAYRISQDVGLFIASYFIVLSLAFLAAAYYTWKSIASDPVIGLRSE